MKKFYKSALNITEYFCCEFLKRSQRKITYKNYLKNVLRPFPEFIFNLVANCVVYFVWIYEDIFLQAIVTNKDENAK